MRLTAFTNGARRYPYQRAENVALLLFMLAGPVVAALRVLVGG